MLRRWHFFKVPRRNSLTVKSAQPVESEISEELATFIDHVSTKTNADGIQILINNKGQQIFKATGCYASGEYENRFPLACSIKMLLAHLALSFADEEAIDLQAPIKTYLPETSDTTCGESINTAQLLSHTSGYAGTQTFNDFKTWDDVHKHLLTTRLNFVPGSVYSYEHTEALITAEILRRVSNSSIKNLLFERILNPAWQNSSNNASKAASSILSQGFPADTLLSRLTDIKKTYLHDFQSSAYSTLKVTLFEAAQIYDYILRNEASRGSSHLNRMPKPVVRIPPMFGGLFNNQSPVSFGLGVAIWNDRFAGISSGFKNEHYAYRYRKDKNVSILVSVSGASYFLRDLILDRVCERFTNPGESQASGSTAPVAIKDLPGQYCGPEKTSVGITLAKDASKAICEFKLHNTLSFLAEISLDAKGGYHLNSPLPNLYLGIRHCEINHCIVLVVGGLAFRKL